MIKKVAGITTIVVVILVIAIGITKANTVKPEVDKKDKAFVAEKVQHDDSKQHLVCDERLVGDAVLLVKAVKKGGLKEKSKKMLVPDAGDVTKQEVVADPKFSDVEHDKSKVDSPEEWKVVVV